MRLVNGVTLSSLARGMAAEALSAAALSSLASISPAWLFPQ
jgi:hypothetical protein